MAILYNGIPTQLTSDCFPYNTQYGNAPIIDNGFIKLSTQADHTHQGSSVILNQLPEIIIEDGLKIEIDLNCSGYYMTSSNLVISLLQRNTSYSGYDIYGISTLAKLISATFSREDPSKFSKIIIEVVSVVNNIFKVYDQDNNIIKIWDGNSSSYFGIIKSMAEGTAGKSAVLHIGAGAYNYEANYIIKNIKVIQSDHITINTSLQSSYSLPPIINISSPTSEQLLVKVDDNIIINKQGTTGFDYNINFDKIWDLYNDGDTIITNVNNAEVSMQFKKIYVKNGVFSNIFTNKDILIDYTVNPSYDNTNIPLSYTYKISLDGEMLFTHDELTNQQIVSSITIPYNKLVKQKYSFITDRNLVITKSNSNGEVISYNIPIKIDPKRLFSKYFNGLSNYISINNWVKPLSELAIQVVKKSSTDSNFTVSIDNSLVSLTGSTLKIGGVSTFVGNIYEIRIWEKGFEHPYTYNQLKGDEDKLYALYRMNEYNSKNVYDSCGELHGIFTGEILNQEIVPEGVSYLTPPVINSENKIIKQHQDHSYVYKIESPISCLFNSIENHNKLVDTNHVELFISNNIIDINKLLMYRKLPFDMNYKVGDVLLQPESGWQRIDDNDINIKYFSSWYYATGISKFNNSTAHTTTNNSDTCTFSFYGTRIRLVQECDFNRVKDAKISIDGIIYTYNTYKSASTSSVLVFEKIYLNKGEHSVIIYKESSGYLIIDSIEIDDDGYLLPIS